MEKPSTSSDSVNVARGATTSAGTAPSSSTLTRTALPSGCRAISMNVEAACRAALPASSLTHSVALSIRAVRSQDTRPSVTKRRAAETLTGSAAKRTRSASPLASVVAPTATIMPEIAGQLARVSAVVDQTTARPTNTGDECDLRSGPLPSGQADRRGREFRWPTWSRRWTMRG